VCASEGVTYFEPYVNFVFTYIYTGKGKTTAACDCEQQPLAQGCERECAKHASPSPANYYKAAVNDAMSSFQKVCVCACLLVFVRMSFCVHARVRVRVHLRVCVRLTAKNASTSPANYYKAAVTASHKFITHT